MIADWDIIVVLHNSEKELHDIWTQVPLEIRERVCAVDNGSTDGSIGIAAALFPHVISGANVGLAVGNNTGLRATSARLVLFANPDVRLTLPGLRALAEALRERSSLVAPRLMGLDGEVQANARGLPFLRDQIGNRLHRHARGGYLWPDVSMGGDVPWLLGAAIASQRSTIERLGGWPEEYFLYFEDVELCLRAWGLGIPVRILEHIRWTHVWAKGSHSVRDISFRLHARSAFRFFFHRPGLIFGRPPENVPRRSVNAESETSRLRSQP